MNKEQEEFNEINNIVSKTINILSDEDFCKLWEYILNKRHQLKEKENKIFGLDELEYYKREVIYKRKAIKDQQEEIERLNNIIEKIESHFEFLKLNSVGGNKEFMEDILEYIKALKN